MVKCKECDFLQPTDNEEVGVCTIKMPVGYDVMAYPPRVAVNTPQAECSLGKQTLAEAPISAATAQGKAVNK